MKKYLLTLFQLLIAFSINAQTYKYTSVNLNLRDGPGASYKVLAIIPVGASVELAEDCDCDWIKVYHEHNVGYVSSRYLTSPKITLRSSTNTATHSPKSNSSIKYYKNSDGQRVQSPTRANTPPAGATALCRDGTYSFSRSRRGTCSHHGGVAKWLD